MIYAGGGILKARAAEALRELAELCDIHVVTTLMARGAFPDDHPLCLGMPGMHGNYTAITSMQESDLLIALGSRFDDRVTGKLDGFAPEAKIIHVDIDPAELGKVRRPDVPIVGDCRLVIEELVLAVRHLLDGGAEAPDRLPWKQTISGWQERFPLTYEQSEPGEALKPQYVLERLAELDARRHHRLLGRRPAPDVGHRSTGSSAIPTPGSTRAVWARWASPCRPRSAPRPGRPDRMVWSVDGDGCFQMTAQELVTAATERIPIKVAILNNAYLGMVRQWQEMFYEERYSEVYLSPDLPDYKLWAEAMGCVGIRVESPEEVDAAIQKANEIDDRPVVVEFRTDSREKVFPMVPAGKANSDVLVDPSQGEGRRAMNGVPGTDVQHHILVVLVENKAGVLARVAGLFARRGYNIHSLAVAPTDDERFSRITVVVDVESSPLEQITKQLFKLVNVVKITELDPREAVEQELMLVTVARRAVRPVAGHRAGVALRRSHRRRRPGRGHRRHRRRALEAGRRRGAPATLRDH